MFKRIMDITGKITGIKYKIFLSEDLHIIEINDFNINNVPTSCILKDQNNSFAISRWVSPKRTRSYPFERVYNTLSSTKKITVIPIVKDEGSEGDRDFIQWDTISLMSLLDIYIIFAYYFTAEKKGNKITNQQFDNKYIISKIKEIENYHSSALHWNLNEIDVNFHSILDKVKHHYLNIENSTNVKLHNIDGLNNFKEKIGIDVKNFMEFSREKSEKAQSREVITIQPKEKLLTISKAKITIFNYLGGKYFLTADEAVITGNKLYITESKHSKNSLLPSKGDIKDGLLKMILFCNLKNVIVNKQIVDLISVLKLTSEKITGSIDTNTKKSDLVRFYNSNNFSDNQMHLVNNLIRESKKNKFLLKINEAK